MNKPSGYICERRDKWGRKSVYDLINIPERVFSIGRLDIDSEGSLTGLARDADVGLNSFTVEVTDTANVSARGTLQINVVNTFNGQKGMNDFAVFATNWLNDNCADFPKCNGCDLSGDSKVTVEDMLIFSGYWIMGND